MAKPLDYSTRIITTLHRRHHRALVVLEGELDWQLSQVSSFITHYAAPLWLGSQAQLDIDVVTAKKAKNWLGQEVDCLIVDANCTFSPEAFGMLAGTVVGGGVVILLVKPTGADGDKPSWQWLRNQFTRNNCFYFQQSDLTLLADEGVHLERQLAHFEAHNDDLDRCIAQPLCQPQPLRTDKPTAPSISVIDEAWGCVTADQTRAVEAIRKVALGHRKRPLVLTADRGRGKSSALGLAAASLMRERNIKIVVTAPSYATAETLFKHARHQLDRNSNGFRVVSESEFHWHTSSLEFIAPDRLIEQEIACDLLIVDEAAAIPSPLLIPLLSRFNRIAFASTIHGYEGTGRGFAIKFRGYLEKLMPQWRGLHIHQPIRWAENDPLEHWVFEALLLNAEMASLSGTEKSVKANPQAYISTNQMLTKAELLADPQRLTQIFGLLINAHYQTSPADFFQMLDDDALQVWITQSDDQVIGCCLLSEEGRFSEELAEKVTLGQRRPKGHLLPQSIAAHIGLTDAAMQQGGRIQRIAVHPTLWRQQIGQQLLNDITCWAQDKGFDYLGTSFGVADELVAFWQSAGFSLIRLGVTKDAASGSYSALAVKPLSPRSFTWWQDAQDLFAINFSAQCHEQFKDLEATTVRLLYRLLASYPSAEPARIEGLVFKQLSAYCQGGLGYDTAAGSIEWLVKRWLSFAVPTSVIYDFACLNEALLINKVIQKKSWAAVIKLHNLVGRKQAEAAMREQVSLLLDSLHSSDKT